jgi:hypothetical protein
MERSTVGTPRIYQSNAVWNPQNLICFCKWLRLPGRSQAQIQEILQFVFLEQHLSRGEVWRNVVYLSPVELCGYSITRLPCHRWPCEQCGKRSGGREFNFVGPWTPTMIVSPPWVPKPTLLPMTALSVTPPLRWQDSTVGQEPWVTYPHGIEFSLIDANLLEPLHWNPDAPVPEVPHLREPLRSPVPEAEVVVDVVEVASQDQDSDFEELSSLTEEEEAEEDEEHGDKKRRRIL